MLFTKPDKWILVLYLQADLNYAKNGLFSVSLFDQYKNLIKYSFLKAFITIHT